MASGERIHVYSDSRLKEDRGGHKRLVHTSPTWPARGAIQSGNYSLRHRFNLDCAMKNISLRIDSGQKIGVIGRTDMYMFFWFQTHPVYF